VQNVIGVLIAVPMGQHPLFGVLNGSVTLTGGPATGLAFAPAFEQAGVRGASTVAIAAAMVGIVSGGLIGGPVGTILIERYHLRREKRAVHHEPPIAAQIVEDNLPEPPAVAPPGEDKESYALLKALVVILVAMWGGATVGGWLTAAGITLPAYIGAMLVAAIIRNVDDATGWIGLSQRTIDDLGSVALSLFLVLALMTLRLWELAGLALPMVAILVVQVAFIAAVCWPVFRLMGRDYDAAVMGAGLCGFMLGAHTKNYHHAHDYVESFINHNACAQMTNLYYYGTANDTVKPSEIQDKTLVAALKLGDPRAIAASNVHLQSWSPNRRCVLRALFASMPRRTWSSTTSRRRSTRAGSSP